MRGLKLADTAFLGLIGSSTDPSVSLLNDLVAYYRLEGEDGNAEWPDSSPNARHLTMSGFPASVAGIIDLGFDSNGVDYLERVDAALGLAGNYSISTWAYQNDSGFGFDGGVISCLNQWSIDYLGNTGYTFGAGDAGGFDYASSAFVPANGVWTHIIGQFEIGVGPSITVNGVTTGPTAIANGAVVDSVLRIGLGILGNIAGRIDETGIWNRLLTADEKTWLFNAGVGNQVI